MTLIYSPLRPIIPNPEKNGATVLLGPLHSSLQLDCQFREGLIRDAVEVI